MTNDKACDLSETITEFLLNKTDNHPFVALDAALLTVATLLAIAIKPSADKEALAFTLITITQHLASIRTTFAQLDLETAEPAGVA